MTDPEQILNRYEGTLAEARRNSDAIRENLAGLRVTERSADGQITVTVNDAGNLVDLDLGAALQRKDGATVGQDVLRVVQAAQARVASVLLETMAPLMGGEDSEATRFMMANVRSAQPPPPADNGWGAAETRMGAIEDEGPPRFQPPPPPPRRPAPRDDQDDFGDGGFLR